MRKLIDDQLTTTMLPQTTILCTLVLIANYLYRTWEKCYLRHLNSVAAGDLGWEVAA